MKPYTLDNYYKAAGLKFPVAFAKYVEMAFKPRPDQVIGLRKAIENERFGLYDEPGVGKTVISQAYSAYWVSEGHKVVVVMPPVLLPQFEESFLTTFKGIEKYLQIHMTDQPKVKREKLFDEFDKNNSWPTVICFSYQLFKQYSDRIKKHYRVVVADEAHALKNPDSASYKNMKQYLDAEGGSAFLPMTGTPVPNELKDAYGLISLTNPGAYKTYREFEGKHFVYTKIRLKQPRQIKIKGRLVTQRSMRLHTGYRGKDEIHQKLYANARRVVKEDVIKLMKPTVIKLPIDLTAKHQRLYEKLARERILELEGELISAVQEQALRQKLLQIITCPHLFVDEGVQIDNNVFKAIDQICDTINISETKLVVFANFIDSIATMKEIFKQYNPAVLNGTTTDKEAQKQKFITDETCRIVFANPVSAGVGVDGFQKVSHNVFFAEPTGVPGTFKQAVERLYRGGQLNRVNVWIAKVRNTISPKAIENMLRKEEDVQNVNRDVNSLLDEIIVGEKLT